MQTAAEALWNTGSQADGYGGLCGCSTDVDQSQLRGSRPTNPRESVNASGQLRSILFWRAFSFDSSSRGATEYDNLFFVR